MILLTTTGVGSIGSLLFGAPYLQVLLPGGLPLGNALAAMGLCSIGAGAVALTEARTWLRHVSASSLLLAVVWLPISLALADDRMLNFSGASGEVWIGLTVTTGLGVVGSLLCASIHSLLRSR